MLTEGKRSEAADAAGRVRRSMRIWRPMIAVWLLLALVLPDAVAAPRRVLLLHSFGRDFGPYHVFSSEFRTELARASAEPIDFHEVALETAVFGEGEGDDPVGDYVSAVHAARPVDLLVPIGAPAALFVLRHRDRILPGVPALFAAVDRRFLRGTSLGVADAAGGTVIDLPGLVRVLLAVLRDTREIFFVIGSSPLERFWLEEARRELAPFGERVALTWSGHMSFDEIQERARSLGPGAAILYTMLALDRAGVPYEQERALARIAAVARAPIFGLFEHQLGLGIVGGPLLSIERVGRETARAAVRILQGEAPSAVRAPHVAAGPPVFDWRELRRWGIREADLPPGSEVHFRQPTFWEQYRWRIVAVVALLVIQAALIVLLLANHVTRRRAESRLRESEDRLALATADLGIWVWDTSTHQVWGNEKWHQLFGLAGGETVAFEGVLDRIHPADRVAVRDAVQRSVAEGREYLGEFRVVLPDGALRWISARGRPEARSEAAAKRMLGSSIDITERKQAEDGARGLSRKLIQAQEQERARVARDLHDDVTQRLARLAIDAAQVEQALPVGGSRDTVRGLQEELARLSEDVHSLSYQLHPSIVEDLGLADALRVECDRLSRQRPEPADLSVRDLPAVIPRAPALCLFRVAQEALRNVVKHAGACPVRVSLAGVDGGLQLVVQDRGVGFEPALQARQPTLGLASMRERVSLLGGDLDVESSPGRGTTVLAWVPIEEVAA
jgi:PAS domain S-box-containing protein